MSDKPEIVDNVQSEGIHNYYFDFLPQKIENEKYEEIKKFFIENYLENYADKVISIMIRLTAFFDLKMYLTEMLEDDIEISKGYAELVGTDIGSFKIEEWAKIIKLVILENISTVQILSINPRFLISINEKFSTELCQIPDNKVNIIKTIVENEGLFLIKNDNNRI